MNENEQIQEMAKIAAKSDKTCRSATIALRLYSKGYRKVERGEWQKCFGNDTKIHTCSNCHISQTVNVYRDKVMFMYCPYCGSDMRGSDVK